MKVKEFSRFDLPSGYKSDYPNNDYVPDLSAHNLLAVINKLNEVIREQHAILERLTNAFNQLKHR